MRYRINYINFRGELKYTFAEGSDANEALGNALDDEVCYSSDSIKEVVNTEEAP